MPSAADDGYFDNRYRIEEVQQRVRQIRRLNEEARASDLWDLLVFSSRLHVLGPIALVKIRQIVPNYDEFFAKNNFFEEHDFGKIGFGRHKVFWIIACYGKFLSHRTVDASDERLTTRVLTTMLAEEY